MALTLNSSLDKSANEYASRVDDRLFDIIPNNQEDFSMTWPWPVGVEWKVGGTHGNNKIWNSLDVTDGNYKCDWRVDEDCVEDTTPLVYAMNSGTVMIEADPCKLHILHASGWGTSYYHTSDLMVSQGEQVQMGQPIGKIAADHKTSICCVINKEGKKVCGKSNAPHLHMGLFKVVNGVKESKTLDGACINGYTVHAGTTDYAYDCNQCWFEKENDRICPARQLCYQEGLPGNSCGLSDAPNNMMHDENPSTCKFCH